MLRDKGPVPGFEVLMLVRQGLLDRLEFLVPTKF